MKNLIKVIEILEAKKDNGTITFEEDAMLCDYIDKVEKIIYTS